MPKWNGKENIWVKVKIFRERERERERESSIKFFFLLKTM